LYIKDQFVYQSNYRSGVRILDAVKVSDGILKEVGSFDLFPQNNNAQFSGTWSNYPYLPSGVNIATSMYEGVFILQPRVLYLEQNAWDICLENHDPIGREWGYRLSTNSECIGYSRRPGQRQRY
jgi:hypothetical protein